MERINTADKRFSDGTAAAGYLDGTVVIAKWLNDIQEEVASFIEAMGIGLDGAKQDQLATAIKTLLQKQVSTYAVDTGGANAYVAAFSPAIAAVTDSMRLRVKVGATNTGASTFAPNAIAAKPIWGRNHQPLQGGELFAGGFAALEWNGALNAGAGVWVLIECTGGTQQVAAATQSQHAVNFGQVAGLGQSWASVAASRVLGTTYTNSTGKAIDVFVSAYSTSNSSLMSATINGVTIQGMAQNTLGINASIYFRVPAGATYSVSLTGTTTLAAWAELR